MRAPSFHGAMRPNRGVLGNDGRCMLDVRHLVERRCGAQQVNGRWCDVWESDGGAHRVAELAHQAADKLRSEGFTVRVRPVLL